MLSIQHHSQPLNQSFQINNAQEVTASQANHNVPNIQKPHVIGNRRKLRKQKKRKNARKRKEKRLARIQERKNNFLRELAKAKDIEVPEDVYEVLNNTDYV